MKEKVWNEPKTVVTLHRQKEQKEFLKTKKEKRLNIQILTIKLKKGNKIMAKTPDKIGGTGL